MSSTSVRRKKPINRWGCKPNDDVCLEHDQPLICRHGCEDVKEHQCKDATKDKDDAIENNS